MQRRTQVVLLCEDVAQRSFFLGLCKRLGFLSRVVRVEVAPEGEGAAEQWVRRQYPSQVRAYRAKANHLTNGLLVVIDGDAVGVPARKSQLDEALEESGQQRRQPADRVAVCVPTWSIETWLLWLCGAGEVDERTAYKRSGLFQRGRESGAVSSKNAIERWAPVSSPGEPASLTDGREEIARLQPSGRD